MALLFWAIGILLVGGLLALPANRSARTVTAMGVGSAVLGSGIGLVSSICLLISADTESWGMPWGKFGSLLLGVDPLSAFFLIPIFGLSLVSAIYGAEYLGRPREGRSHAFSWFCFNVLVASMACVVLARSALVFLVAWEIMSIASFFLVTQDNHKENVREAGWVYLVATHLGTAFLFVMFLLMGETAGWMDFEKLGVAATLAPASTGLWFGLALVGFGTKAGFVPFHVWLPEAHPAAPSHVSAVMSGVMIKTGIYGLLRLLTFLGTPAG